MRRGGAWVGAVVVLAVLLAAASSQGATSGGLALRQNGDRIVGAGVVGNARFGSSVALSTDGTTALVGGPDDNGGKGAAWVFAWSGGRWVQQGAKLVPNDGVGNARFGTAVALSADGGTAFVGGPYDDGDRGAVWEFRRAGPAWQQEGTKLPAVAGIGKSLFGSALALSGDATTLVIGGLGDDNGKGAAWVYLRAGSLTKLVPGACASPCQFGRSVATSDDGRAMLVGAADGVAAQTPCEFPCYKGAVYSYTRTTGTWQAAGAFGGTGAQDFGYSVALSADGTTAIVGGPTDGTSVGAAWVYVRSSPTTWTVRTKLAPTDANVGNVTKHVGRSVAISPDATNALAGGPGVNSGRGAVWLFSRTGESWVQQGPRNEAGGEIGPGALGASVALASDGNSALVGGPFDATGVGAVWAFAAVPQVVAVTPASGPVAGGTQVTLAGENLTKAAGVRFGSVAASSFTVVSSTQIRAVSPAHAAGTVDVTVRNSGGTSVAGAGSKFTYVGPAAPPPPPPPPPSPPPAPVPDTRPPVRPAALRGSFAGRTLRLRWRPARDDTALAYHALYRDGKQIRKLSPKATRADIRRFRTTRRTVLVVRGVDASGNRSAPSNAVIVRPRRGGGYVISHARG